MQIYEISLFIEKKYAESLVSGKKPQKFFENIEV